MIRKMIGWALATISAILLLLIVGVGIYSYSSSKIELATTVFQSGIVSSFVCVGLSILLLKRRKDCNTKTSWWHKTRRALGYIFIIIFMFSIPGLHYFNIYEILPRILILIIAYFFLRAYNNDMRKLLYNLGLLLLGLSVYCVTWTWLEWTLVGVIPRMIFLTISLILIYKYG